MTLTLFVFPQVITVEMPMTKLGSSKSCAFKSNADADVTNETTKNQYMKRHRSDDLVLRLNREQILWVVVHAPKNSKGFSRPNIVTCCWSLQKNCKLLPCR